MVKKEIASIASMALLIDLAGYMSDDISPQQ
jgi:hypothetical protein